MTAPAAHMPLRLPDAMVRTDVGPYMRSLREHYKLSEQDVSERLHIRVKYVQAIEAGQFDTLPGKAYAKGYVHTYADFLGLDGDHVVEKCFGIALAREQQQHFVPEPKRASVQRQKFSWQKHWLSIAAVAVFAFGLYSVFSTPTKKEQEQEAAAPSAQVPENMLASMRTGVMPTTNNIGCLEDRALLDCFYEGRLTERWVTPPAAPSYAGISAENASE